jgi:essential nuclear protein 1
MPKEKTERKGAKLRHAPLGRDIEQTGKQIKAPRKNVSHIPDDEEESSIPQTLGSQIFNQARDQRFEMTGPAGNSELQNDSDYDVSLLFRKKSQIIATPLQDDLEEEEDDEELVEYDGEYVQGADLTESEEAIIHRFLDLDKQESRTLADIIMNKIREKETGGEEEEENATIATIPAKVY